MILVNEIMELIFGKIYFMYPQEQAVVYVYWSQNRLCIIQYK